MACSQAVRAQDCPALGRLTVFREEIQFIGNSSARRLLSTVPYAMGVPVRPNSVQFVLDIVHEGKATAANVGRVMQVELVVVDQGLEVPDEKAHAGSSELGPEALNPLIGDGCAVPMAGVVPMQENLYCCHGAVLRPTISPQDLRAFARDRQALCVIVPNDSWIVVGVPDPQPHHPPGITIHTSVYGKAIRL